MEKQFNYKSLFDQALVKIKSVRDPRATRADLSDLRWHEVEQEIMFDFEGITLKKYGNVADAANKITISCLHFMISNLMLHYGCQTLCLQLFEHLSPNEDRLNDGVSASYSLQQKSPTD